ncbi:MAG: glutamine synthetase type III, partial [Lachnospiraceae bacterium]|nr:glutamine synthetase type III [Lachnospiraceae bacterium]
DLLRISVATAGNDHRLGANEAPPAVVSMFLGDELNEIIESIVSGSQYAQHEKVQMEIGVDVLPKFPKDSTDRNRTSPFAFTGNKFEFRMLGSANSIACANIMLNTSVADSLCEFADRLEKASDFNAELAAVIKETITAHKRIIFNGNGYDESWIKEATEDRGLLNLRSTPEAMERFLDQKNKDLFLKFGVFSLAEMQSRHDILLENYSKIINIEALTMIDMARKDILPAVTEYIKELADTAIAVKQAAGVEAVFEKDLISKLTKLQGDIAERTQVLEDAVIEVHEISDILAQSYAYRDKVFVAMQDLRAAADQAESLVSAKVWPFPSYGELLFGVR